MWRPALLFALMAGQVQALSCMRPSIEASYGAAARAEAKYIIVAGALSFDEKKLPRPSEENPNISPEETLIPASVSGVAMGRGGFDTPFKTPITLNVGCLGPWCGGIGSGEDTLMFLRKDDAGYVLEEGPCPFWSFSGDIEAAKREAYACYRSKSCK